MPNGRSNGRRRGRRPKQRNDEKGGRTVQTAAPALFAFMGSLSSSVGLSAWRWACAVPRCGSRCFRNGQRKAIIRTHRLSETGSDYIGLVPVVGLEPTRCCHQRILSRTFERANKVEIRPYRPFKVRIKAHCAALFPRWSVKSIAASNNLKAWFDFNHYNAF